MTLYSTTGKYKPMSTTVEAPTVEEFKANLKTYKKQALKKIAGQRYRDGASLLRDGYTVMKWRIYDAEERRKHAVQDLISKMRK